VHLLEDKQNSASMIEGLNFSAIIDSNPAREIIDDQMGDDLVSSYQPCQIQVLQSALSFAVAASKKGMRCIEKTVEWDIVTFTLLMIICATQRRAADSF
jgi:hypothetical protein